MKPLFAAAAAALLSTLPAHAQDAPKPIYLFDLLAGKTASDAKPAAPADGAQGQLVRASWYGGGERLGRRTSTGEVFRPMERTAAHRTLPFGTMLKVTEADTGRSTIVRVNDRGPAAYTGRALDLSRGAAMDLGIVAMGQAPVYIEVLR